MNTPLQLEEDEFGELLDPQGQPFTDEKIRLLYLDLVPVPEASVSSEFTHLLEQSSQPKPHPVVPVLQNITPIAEETSITEVRSGGRIAVDGVKDQDQVSPEILCSRKCKGDLMGDHECQRLQRRLHITCLDNNCKKIFYTKNNFNRHCETKHVKGIRTKQLLYDCLFDGCNRAGKEGFSRKDNMLQHVRTVHKVKIPVKKYWFGKESASEDRVL